MSEVRPHSQAKINMVKDNFNNNIDEKLETWRRKMAGGLGLAETSSWTEIEEKINIDAKTLGNRISASVKDAREKEEIRKRLAEAFKQN